MVAVAVIEPPLLLKCATAHRNWTETIMNNAEHIYGIAVNHAQTVQVCIDRLHELGANEQLKLLTARLQKLAVQATPGDDHKGTKGRSARHRPAPSPS
jgi:hypothetical protein